MKTLKKTLLAFSLIGMASAASAYEADKPTCIAPAKPGGGFDLTCRVVSTGFERANLLDAPMAVKFMPGGVGAVAYNHINKVNPDDGDSLVAFSSGSLLNLAQGKFGKGLDENDARWVGTAGVDYGAIMVKSDAPWQTLEELVTDIQKDPSSFVLGAGGGVGSQDWMKAALLMKASGVDPKKMRYVAYEGGGEAIAALMGNHIKVYPGDIGEMKGQLDAGKVRVLAVMAPERLEGEFADIPTAHEQGYNAEWTIVRGYYLGPKVSDEAYEYWSNKFAEAYKTEGFKQTVAEKGLMPFYMHGASLDEYVKGRVQDMRELAKTAGLIQ
ncbi:Bug family tripartite tricarboxylate transporter substrate binding protein [Marinomonas ostreistagni]|uniref:Bug family tripartite tricarboxylate transporter substrate binding protein n=1 Tax=Marinomonas ostreistagni TaxID=359209 RepID=UPI0019513C73|nr:tripartite tricarboxylate transporter substrate binding protein [Marinomonas ostreistagni]MBM6549788.1 tripartite tricarboxylate transporter substrate binding protein [Marinomonas ostreistagni]